MLHYTTKDGDYKRSLNPVTIPGSYKGRDYSR